jgi:hypothetical protein
MANEDWKLPWEGACRCGQVRIRITAPPLLTMACHCTGCQRMTSSAFSLSVAIPADGFAVVAGEPVIGGLHGASRHYFCGHCMSWMFTRPEGLDSFVNVRSTLLDVGRALDPFIETWTSERVPWATTPAVHSYPALPELSAFDALISEYTNLGTRPSTPA